MGPKKTIHIIHSLKIGGVENAVFSGNELIRNSLNYEILVIDKINPSITFDVNFLKKNVKLFNGNFPLDFINIIKILIYLNKEKPEIIITSLWRSVFIGLLYRLFNKKTKWIIFKHSSKYKHFFDSVIHLISFKLVDFVFADSQASKESINLKNAKFECIIVPMVFKATSSKLKPKNLNLNNSIKFIFYGRLHPVKQIDLSIRFLSYLEKRLGRKIVFDFFGPDEDNTLNKLLEICNELNFSSAHYGGCLNSEELNDKLKDYSFFIQLSKYEGQALSVVEAMQNGLVCIVTPVGEIANYTKDLSNAIHFKIKNQNIFLEENFLKFESIIKNPALFNLISCNSIDSFSKTKDYPQEIINNLKIILNQK